MISTIDGPEPRQRFGSAVSMTSDGNRLLVGAPGEPGSSAGAAYYFEWDGTRWGIILPIPGLGEAENFGTSVIILDDDGDVVAMGGPNSSEDRGVIRVYRRQGGAFWGQLGGDIVGEAGDLLGTTLSAGPSNRVVAGTAAGSFRVFEYDSQQNDWVRVGLGEPLLGSGIVSVASSGNGDVAVGTVDGSVSVYAL